MYVSRVSGVSEVSEVLESSIKLVFHVFLESVK